MQRTHAQPQAPTPVAGDAHATAQQLLDRAAVDYAHTKQEQGGTGSDDWDQPQDWDNDPNAGW